MLDTVGPELQVVNKSEKSISLQVDGFVVLTPNQEIEASSELLPINFDGLSKVWQQYTWNNVHQFYLKSDEICNYILM